LVKFNPEKKQRIPGLFKGKMWMADDFNNESEEIEKMFSIK